jgi:hypothetical protein
MQSCGPRITENTGLRLATNFALSRKSCNYDTMQGYKCTFAFWPITASRLLVGIPLFFDIDNRLKGQRLTCLELMDGSFRNSFNGVDIPSNFVNGWITLKDNCNNTLAEFPMSRINQVLNGRKNFYFKSLPVDWSKSYIKLTSTAGLSSSGFLFNIWTVPN